MFSSRTLKSNYKWCTPFISQKISFDENTTKEDIIGALEVCYEQMNNFEHELIEEFGKDNNMFKELNKEMN